MFVPIAMAVERAGTAWSSTATLQFTVIGALGLSNGHLTTSSMMFSTTQPGLIPDELQTVGNMMTSSVFAGILLGSVLAILTQIGISATATK